MSSAPDQFEIELHNYQAELKNDPGATLRPFYDTICKVLPDRAHDFLLEACAMQIFALVRSDRPFFIDEFLRQFEALTPEDLRQLFLEKTEAESLRLKNAVNAKAKDAGNSDAPALPGFDGKWTKAGKGGQGQVWKGRYLELDREEAVKVLHLPTSIGEQSRATEEARKLAKIDHAAVCKVFDCSIDHFGRPCLRMKCINGPTAKVWAAVNGNDDPRRIARLLEKVARGVQAIHAVGLVHCDIKPDNILVVPTENAEGEMPVVVDLGLARTPGPLNGRVVGTQDYMAPEQLKGISVGVCSDIFALGATFAELLSDTRPTRESPEIATIACADARAICNKAMEESPDRRYASADQMADDLLKLSRGRGEELLARPFGSFRRMLGWAARFWKSAALCLLLTAITIGLLQIVRQSQLESRRKERDGLVAQLEEEWKHSLTEHTDWNRIDSILSRLELLDQALADDQRVKYIDALLGMREISLERLERATEYLVSRPEGATRLRSPIRSDYFHKRVSPEDRFDKLDFYFRPDGARLANLERETKLGEIFGSIPGRPGVSATLIRAYMASGRLDDAWKLGQELLERDDLFPAWRSVVIRDLVWVAISSGKASREIEVAELLKSSRFRTQDGELRPEYLELAVEEARLCATSDPLRAAEILDTFLKSQNIDLKPESNRTLNARLTEGPTNVNVPVLFYLDASLLRGFLPKADKDVWKTSFNTVRGHRTGSYYEAAVIGSLAGELAEKDAVSMTVSTAEDAATFSPVFQDLRNLSSNKRAMTIVTALLNRAWTSDRGKDLAEQIATRRLPFDTFVYTQLRLWIYEGLRILTREIDAPLANGEDMLFWGIAVRLQTGLTSGSLTEQQLLQLVEFVVGDPNGALAIPPGAVNTAKWFEVSKPLAAELRGPLAYVIALAYSRHVPGVGPLLLRTTYIGYAKKHLLESPDAALEAVLNPSVPTKP